MKNDSNLYMKEFLESHKTFVTSQATKAGFTKKQLKQEKYLVKLGVFPNRSKRLEAIWCWDEELSDLVRKSKKIKDPSVLRDRIEEIVSEKLGFKPMEKNND